MLLWVGDATASDEEKAETALDTMFERGVLEAV
jgi:hypothetical protein